MSFSQITGPWFWIAIGLVLLVLELLGAGGFLLATGVAALAVALLMFFVDIGWPLQFAIFGVLSVIATYVYWKHIKPNSVPSEDPLLNNRMARLVGQKTSLISKVEGGVARVQVHDALWTVHCDEPLEQGTLVEITGYEGSTLTVKAV